MRPERIFGRVSRSHTCCDEQPISDQPMHWPVMLASSAQARDRAFSPRYLHHDGILEHANNWRRPSGGGGGVRMGCSGKGVVPLASFSGAQYGNQISRIFMNAACRERVRRVPRPFIAEVVVIQVNGERGRQR